MSLITLYPYVRSSEVLKGPGRLCCRQASLPRALQYCLGLHSGNLLFTKLPFIFFFSLYLTLLLKGRHTFYLCMYPFFVHIIIVY